MLKIAVIGANGKSGRLIVAEAASPRIRCDGGCSQ